MAIYTNFLNGWNDDLLMKKYRQSTDDGCPRIYCKAFEAKREEKI